MDKLKLLSLFEEIKFKYEMEFDLKDEQCSLIVDVLNKKDCMGILGTGFGKSLTFVLPPILLEMMYSDQRHISVVVSPLRSLMQSQVASLQEKGIAAAAVLQRSEMSESTVTGIKRGDYSVVFISPEALNSDLWSSVFRGKHFRDLVALVAIDEAHCVIEWGESFREEYKNTTWLRPVLKNCPFLFLTATCTRAMKDDILRQFCIQDVSVTAAIPNRPNIFLTYKYQPGMRIDEELTFYIDELLEKGEAARKCIIYTRVNPAGEIYEEIMNRLKGKAYNDKGERLVDVFVSKTSELAKSQILESFPKETSPIRCLIASSAFGMGVDIPDVELVIHWGVSTTVLDYWQEVGRAGRDGRRVRPSSLQHQLPSVTRE